MFEKKNPPSAMQTVLDLKKRVMDVIAPISELSSYLNRMGDELNKVNVAHADVSQKIERANEQRKLDQQAWDQEKVQRVKERSEWESTKKAEASDLAKVKIELLQKERELGARDAFLRQKEEALSNREAEFMEKNRAIHDKLEQVRLTIGGKV